MKLTSTAFSHGAEIPVVHTCEGPNQSPPLTWKGLSPEAKSLALIVDDPDAPDPKAPKMTYVHWVIYNLPAEDGGLPEAVELSKLPVGALTGTSDYKRAEWGGPCPPIGRHRYFFKLYALDTVLPDLQKPTKARLEEAMAGHILERVELMGTYEKKPSASSRQPPD